MKKFSQTYINDYKELDLFNIGFEFEFYTNKLSFYKLLEELNLEMSPKKIHGYRKYHSSFDVNSDNWKIEPDLSGGSDMIELVTGVMEFQEAKYYLIKILKFIDKWCYTTDRCSVHINISFNGEKTQYRLSDINVLKLITRTDEEAIYNIFPSRKNNIYAKSVKKLIPFKDYDFSNVEISSIMNNIKLPNDKYYGINLINMYNDYVEQCRVEYRYIGGKDYQKRLGNIIDLMSRFCLDLYENVTTGFDQNDIEIISTFLDSKINNFKNFRKYDNFLVEYPNIHLQVNQQSSYDIINSYYSKMYKKIYEFVESIENLHETCIINYYTEGNRFEIVNTTFTAVMPIENYDFIGCDIINGIFTKCTIDNTKIHNAELNKTTVNGSDLKECKMINVNAENSILDECYFINGYMNSQMVSGIFRSGKIGPNGNISETTKIVTNKDNFFKTDVEDIEKQYKKK